MRVSVDSGSLSIFIIPESALKEYSKQIYTIPYAFYYNSSI